MGKISLVTLVALATVATQMRLPGLAGGELFTEEGPELTSAQRNRAIRRAQSAAREAQQTAFLTVKKMYRRYREEAGDAFMSFPEWKEHYQEAYRGATGGLGDSRGMF